MQPVLDWAVVVLPTILAVMAALVSTYPLESQRSRVSWRIGVIIFGVFISGITWLQQSKTRTESAVADLKIERLQSTLDAIKSAMVLPDTAASVQNLSQLSNTQLRQRVADLATRMRAFQANIDEEMIQDILPRLPRNATQEERQKDWNEMATRLTTHSADNSARYRAQLLPEALALREVLSRRMGILPPYQPGSQTVALDFGMLAGVAPAAKAADYLESLARRLPP